MGVGELLAGVISKQVIEFFGFGFGGGGDRMNERTFVFLNGEPFFYNEDGVGIVLHIVNFQCSEIKNQINE